MGDEISMKTRALFFLLMLCSVSLADNSQTQIEHYDEIFSAINEQRKGLDESELKNISMQNYRPLGEGSLRKSFQLLRSEEHTSELQSRTYLVCRLLLEKKKS